MEWVVVLYYLPEIFNCAITAWKSTVPNNQGVQKPMFGVLSNNILKPMRDALPLT